MKKWVSRAAFLNMTWGTITGAPSMQIAKAQHRRMFIYELQNSRFIGHNTTTRLPGAVKRHQFLKLWGPIYSWVEVVVSAISNCLSTSVGGRKALIRSRHSCAGQATMVALARWDSTLGFSGHPRKNIPHQTVIGVLTRKLSYLTVTRRNQPSIIRKLCNINVWMNVIDTFESDFSFTVCISK